MKHNAGGHKIIVEQGIVAGNAYDKYGTRNPLARAMMSHFLRSLCELVRATGATACIKSVVVKATWPSCWRGRV